MSLSDDKKNRIKGMTVREVIDSIGSREIVIEDIAEAIDTTTRTVKKYIKKLGFIWNASEQKHIPNEVETEKNPKHNPENDSKNFVQIVLDGGNTSVSKEKVEKPQNSSEKQATKNGDSNNSVDYSNLDEIDKLMLGSQLHNSRVQRAYWLDSDIAEVIDKISDKQKSEFVNLCLRKVFEEKDYI